MRVFVCLYIFAGTLLAGNPQGFWENPFGIVPLHSTRADVERLYGDPVPDSCRCNFRRSKETIHVAFAISRCVGPEYGWNVPKDTVQSFWVTPYEPLRLAELAPDLTGFVERYSPEDIRTTYYTNVEKGIAFSVQDGHVIGLEYFPPSRENGKRCQGFPAYNGVPPPRPFDVVLNPNNVHGILDTLGAELARIPQLQGYIIAYAGRKSRRGEAKQMAEEARHYLIETRMIPPDRIIALDGGYRETAQYDLFTLSLEMPPPTPTPTLPSNEVQIVKPAPRNKRHSSKVRYKYGNRT
ncbi:MAG TPA: hypothetical protein DC047_05895 [Blastocatellia bacterium]|nr:hypothetical protein [Blastocatellia bacterium]